MPKVFKNTILYALGNMMPVMASFFLLPVYTRFLSPADYGIVSSMHVLNVILAIIFTLAVERSIYRLYWDYKTEIEKKYFLGTIIVTIVCIATIVLIFLFVFKSIFGLIYRTIPFHPFYTYSIFAAYFCVFQQVPKINLQLNKKAGSFVMLSTVQIITNTTFILWFVIVERAGAEGMLKGQMLGHGIMLPVYLCMTYHIIKLSFNTTILRQSLKFSLPLVPAAISGWVLNLSDRIFIEQYFSLSDVGIYSLGYKIAGLVLLFSGAFNLAYGPLFYQLANSDNQVEAKGMLFSYNNTYVTIIIFICFFISFFSKEIVIILMDAKYVDAYKIVPIISFAYLISQISGLFNLMISQEKKVVQLMLIAISGAVLNIILNFLLVPVFGAYGAAYATVFTFTMIGVIQYWYAKKCYFISFQWKRIVSVFFFLSVIVTFANSINANIYASFLFKALIIIISSIFLFLINRENLTISKLLSKLTSY